MPAKPLTPEQLEDAQRLKRMFLAYKDTLAKDGKPNAQDDLAEKLPFGQSAMSQYINGKIPLNGEALLAFCDLIGCKPWEISPSIYKAERDRSALWIGAGQHPSANHGGQLQQVFGDDVVDALCSTNPEKVRTIEESIRMMLGLPSGKGLPPLPAHAPMSAHS